MSSEQDILSLRKNIIKNYAPLTMRMIGNESVPHSNSMIKLLRSDEYNNLVTSIMDTNSIDSLNMKLILFKEYIDSAINRAKDIDFTCKKIEKGFIEFLITYTNKFRRFGIEHEDIFNWIITKPICFYIENEPSPYTFIYNNFNYFYKALGFDINYISTSINTVIIKSIDSYLISEDIKKYENIHKILGFYLVEYITSVVEFKYIVSLITNVGEYLTRGGNGIDFAFLFRYMAESIRDRNEPFLADWRAISDALRAENIYRFKKPSMDYIISFDIMVYVKIIDVYKYTYDSSISINENMNDIANAIAYIYREEYHIDKNITNSNIYDILRINMSDEKSDLLKIFNVRDVKRRFKNIQDHFISNLGNKILGYLS